MTSSSKNLHQLEERLVKTVPFSNRLPFYYLEKCKVVMRGGHVTALTDETEESLPVASIAVLMLGPGTSVSCEAAKHLCLRGCHLCFSGGGGIPHFATTVAYRSPKNKILQYAVCSDEEKRKKAVQVLLRSRSLLIEKFTNLPPLRLKDGESLPIIDLLLLEARWAKSAYASSAHRYGKMPLATRSPGEKNPLSLMNHFLYSVAMGAILSLGYDPNMGLMHGVNRGGGLVFDLADVWKPSVTLENSFIAHSNGLTQNDIKSLFIKSCNETGAAAGMVSLLKEIFS